MLAPRNSQKLLSYISGTSVPPSFPRVGYLTDESYRLAHPLWLASLPRLRRLPHRRPNPRPTHALPTRHLHPAKLARNPPLLGHHRLLRLHQHRRRVATPEIRRRTPRLAHIGFLRHFDTAAGVGAERRCEGDFYDVCEYGGLGFTGLELLYWDYGECVCVRWGGWADSCKSIYCSLSPYSKIKVDTNKHQLSEEIHNAQIVVPRSIMTGIAINGTLGFGMILTVLFRMGDLDAVLPPRSAIAVRRCGDGVDRHGAYHQRERRVLSVDVADLLGVCKR
jgi:hypothetical protein